MTLLNGDKRQVIVLFQVSARAIRLGDSSPLIFQTQRLRDSSRNTSLRFVSAALLGGELLQSESRLKLFSGLETHGTNRLRAGTLEEGDRRIDMMLNARCRLGFSSTFTLTTSTLPSYCARASQAQGQRVCMDRTTAPRSPRSLAVGSWRHRLQRCVGGVLDLRHLLSPPLQQRAAAL